MSTISSPAPTAHPMKLVPELENGDRLTRAEFERRYEAMPDLKKAELIEGVVYMPSPVRHRRHSRPNVHICTWLGRYEAGTTAMHNFELGTAPGFSLLPPCRLQHLVDRRMSTGAFGLLHFGTRLLVDRFAVTRRPHATQQDLQSRDQLFARQLLGKPIGNHPRGEQLRQRSQLLLDVQEDLLHRHRLHRHVH